MIRFYLAEDDSLALVTITQLSYLNRCLSLPRAELSTSACGILQLGHTDHVLTILAYHEANLQPPETQSVPSTPHVRALADAR